MEKLEAEEADNPLGTRSSAGKLFGASGGVMEAALRTAHFKITGQEMPNYELKDLRGMDAVKESKVKIGDLELGVAVVNGMANAAKLLEEIKNGRKDIHFIEVMACPGGCVGGGGQPIPASTENIIARMKSIHKIDADSKNRTSHTNPQIIELYDQFLGEPNSHKAHELLHTTYGKREIFLK
jgi:iron only hydrogenase large subunit-like protein